MNQTSKHNRILGISLSSPGFGYAVIEGDMALIDYGNKVINDRENTRSLAGIEKVIIRTRPDILVLQDVNAKGVRRWPRIKELHQKIIAMTKKRKLRVEKISAKSQRSVLLGDVNGTKYEVAEAMAKRFAEKLTSKLPPKRKPWSSEDRRMDIFEAVGLALTFSCYIQKRRIFTHPHTKAICHGNCMCRLRKI